MAFADTGVSKRAQALVSSVPPYSRFPLALSLLVAHQICLRLCSLLLLLTRAVYLLLLLRQAPELCFIQLTFFAVRLGHHSHQVGFLVISDRSVSSDVRISSNIIGSLPPIGVSKTGFAGS